MLKIEGIFLRLRLKTFEEILGHKVSYRRKKKILKGIWKIKKTFCREQGLINALFLTNHEILYAFKLYTEDEIRHRNSVHKASVRLWKKFVAECTESTDIIEWYLTKGETG